MTEHTQHDHVKVGEGPDSRSQPLLPAPPGVAPACRTASGSRLHPAVRLVWHGDRIKRMIFPSGKTVEFLS